MRAPKAAKPREHHEPRRVLDEHYVAGHQETPRHEIDGLRGTSRRDHLVRRRLDADVREPRRQRLAQW
jgi:hypothetical protein